MTQTFAGADKVAFAQRFMSWSTGEPIVLDWWQQRYLEGTPQLLVVNKSRRVGWSFVTAMKGLIEALDPNVHKYVKQFVSYSLADAKEKIGYARELYHSIYPKRYRKKLRYETKTSLEFVDVGGKSHSRLVSLPCKPPRGMGSSHGGISLDEFAFHKNADQIYTASLPVIARGGSIEIGSTPFGQSGRYYEIYADRERYPNYARNAVPWYWSPWLCTNVLEAVQAAESMSDEQLVWTYGREIMQEIFRSMPLEDFLQEFCLSFRDEQTSFITLDMIHACTPVGDDEVIAFASVDELQLGYDPAVHGTLYAGYDVGRTQDASELLVFGYHPEQNVKISLASITYRQMPFDDQEDELLKLLNTLPVARLCIDSTGLGMHLAENLQKKRVVGSRGSSSRTRSRRSLRMPPTSPSSARSTCCPPTESCTDRFIRSSALLLLLVTLALMWIGRRNTTGTSSGLWRWRSTR